MVERFQADVRDLEKKTQSDKEALQNSLDVFKVDLQEAGLVDSDI